MKLPFLKRGDTVSMVSTAKFINPEIINYSTELFNEWGLNVKVGKHSANKQGNFAGTFSERMMDLQEALNDKNSKAIFFNRGGYGSIHLIDYLDFTNFKKRPKWLIGFSDITIFLNHVLKFEIPTIHAPMPLNLFDEKENKALYQSLHESLFGDLSSYMWQHNGNNNYGTCKGKLIGGNLSVFTSLVGTNSMPDSKGKILFLEEIDEQLYHVERMLFQIKRNGIFNNIEGLILGGFSKIQNSEWFVDRYEKVIRSVLREFDFPIAFDFPAGHIPINQSLYFGIDAELSVSNDASSLEFIL